MGHVKDVETATGDDTMAAQGGLAPETRPLAGADTAADVAPGGRDDDHADNALQGEEPGYGYGV